MLVYNINELYCDNIYRKFSVVTLNCQAHRILSDSFILNNYREIIEERNIVGNAQTDIHERFMYDTPYSNMIFKSYALENVKIALALEIHLKSLVLYKGYLVHYVKQNNRFYKEQKKLKRPISIIEYLEEYQEEDRFTELSDQSLIFSDLVSDKFVNILCLKPGIKEIIDIFIKQRNTIHLPINPPPKLLISNDNLCELVKYINENIIDFTYEVSNLNGFNSRNLNLNKF